MLGPISKIAWLRIIDPLRTSKLQTKPQTVRIVTKEMKVYKIFRVHGSMFGMSYVYIERVLRGVVCLCHAEDELGTGNVFVCALGAVCLKSCLCLREIEQATILICFVGF